MRLHDLPTRDLLHALRDTERSLGADSVSARILLRELERRVPPPAPTPNQVSQEGSRVR